MTRMPYYTHISPTLDGLYVTTF